MYNFTVVAFDPLGEKKEARQTVEIFVIDENDHAPKFEIENERIEISEVWFSFYLPYYSRSCIYNSVHLKFQTICKPFETHLNYFPSQRFFQNIKFGSAIYRVQVGDDDTQEANRLCLFELADSVEDPSSNSIVPSVIFRIGPTSGIVYVAGQLDFEMQQHYNLTIRARNLVGGPTLTR